MSMGRPLSSSTTSSSASMRAAPCRDHRRAAQSVPDRSVRRQSPVAGDLRVVVSAIPFQRSMLTCCEGTLIVSQPDDLSVAQSGNGHDRLAEVPRIGSLEPRVPSEGAQSWPHEPLTYPSARHWR